MHVVSAVLADLDIEATHWSSANTFRQVSILSVTLLTREVNETSVEEVSGSTAAESDCGQAPVDPHDGVPSRPNVEPRQGQGTR